VAAYFVDSSALVKRYSQGGTVLVSADKDLNAPAYPRGEIALMLGPEIRGRRPSRRAHPHGNLGRLPGMRPECAACPFIRATDPQNRTVWSHFTTIN
jgi:hypothetical protein